VIDRPKEPPKLDDEEEDEFGGEFANERPTTPGGDAVPNERPTVSPPFDVEEFAKHSDSKMQAMKTPSPEGGETSTKPPPALDFDLAGDLPEVDSQRSPQITLTDEDETEVARIRSVLMHSDPPPDRPSPGRALAEPRARRAGRAEGGGHESVPPTRAYPSEYERDPFAHLSAGTSGNDLGQLGGEMGDRFSLGDYTGALEIAESILASDPVDAEALRCAEDSRAKLIQMYTARIGPLDRIPMVLVAREQLRWLSIDHRAGFLLSHVDGVSSLEMILDVSGMPLLDALKILAELQQQRVISFR
jgi:hypothetical protein